MKSGESARRKPKDYNSLKNFSTNLKDNRKGSRSAYFAYLELPSDDVVELHLDCVTSSKDLEYLKAEDAVSSL